MFTIMYTFHLLNFKIVQILLLETNKIIIIDMYEGMLIYVYRFPKFLNFLNFYFIAYPSMLSIKVLYLVLSLNYIFLPFKMYIHIFDYYKNTLISKS